MTNRTKKELPAHISPDSVKTIYLNQTSIYGRVYRIKREVYYCPIKKNTVVHSTTNIGHIDPVTQELLPNRPKRKNGEGRAPRKRKAKATPTKVEATEILDNVGALPQIDANNSK